MSSNLSSTVHPGIVNVAGKTPESQKLVEILLEDDRRRHHCFFNQIGFHNHLSHHLLAAYDLGAPAKVLQAINDDAADGIKVLRPIDLGVGDELKTINKKNWTEYLGQPNYYVKYLDLFTAEVAANGAGVTLNKYLLGPEANGNGSDMFARFLAGVLHPFIMTGAAVEFGSDIMIAQALAQMAVHDNLMPDLYTPVDTDTSAKPLSLLQILRRIYDLPGLQSATPYDTHEMFIPRIHRNATPTRIASIRSLASQWFSTTEGTENLEKKMEELMWFATLLLGGVAQEDGTPRLDFFLMHFLNATLFLRSIVTIIPSPESKVKLFKGFLSVGLMYVVIRGRPQIDLGLIMSYTSTPLPPSGAPKLNSASSTVGDPNVTECINPWNNILSSVIHAPDSHILKVTRMLYFAAQRYGHTAPGSLPGTLEENGEETHKGIAAVDGSIFVRTAGVAMGRLGWVTHGQEAGDWDRVG